ncbi:MAG: restriction endonuclease subunit S [Deltaproteobacteria bacterium]|nr:restriction endonuclease subunit S [Candidatus Tharpella aukensis]
MNQSFRHFYEYEVPSDWELSRLKFSVTCNDESLPETTDPDFEISYVDISSVNLVDGITAVEQVIFEKAPSRARRIVQDGDTIISTVRTYLKAIALIENPPENMIVSTGFAVIRPLESVNQRFLGYVLQNASFVGEVVANSTGVSYPAINPSKLVCIPFSYPKDIAKQQKIADFLDWKTGKIDGLIAKKRQLIEKLKEKRIALITQTVTKGLNSNAPMRDSGIPWLGDVPEHWEVRKLKFCCTVAGGGTPNTNKPEYWDGDILWVSPKDMKSVYIRGTKDYITELGLQESATTLFLPDTVLVVVRSGILRHTIPVALNSVSVSINQDMKALIPHKKALNSSYLMELIFANQRALLPLWTKPGCTVESIEMEYMLNTEIPLPPIAEQLQIAESVKSKRSKIEDMGKIVGTVIEKLSEYRTALITAATTGKVDVRNFQMPPSSYHDVGTDLQAGL